MCVLALGLWRHSISAPGPWDPSPVRLLWMQWTHGAGCLLSWAYWTQTRDDPPGGSQQDGPIQWWREMGSLLVRESCTADPWAWRYPLPFSESAHSGPEVFIYSSTIHSFIYSLFSVKPKSVSGIVPSDSLLTDQLWLGRLFTWPWAVAKLSNPPLP